MLVAINGSIPYMEVCGNMPNMVICLYVEVCLLWQYGSYDNLVLLGVVTVLEGRESSTSTSVE